MAIGNIFATGMDAMDQSYARQKGYGQDRARVQAGRKVATGDYAGGAAELYANGQLDAGSEVQNYGQGQEDRQAAQVASQKAAEAQQLKTRAEGLIRVATGLKGVQPGQRLATLRSQAPMLQHLGIDPAPFMGLQEQQLDDANLDLFTGKVTEAVKGVLGAPGSQLLNPQTGAVMASVPDRPDYQKLGPGEMLIDPRGGGQPTAAAPQVGPEIQALGQKLQSMGVRISSAQRTPEHNREVGGAPNSYHLTGHAYDLVPPQGMTMAQLEQNIRGSGIPFAEVINEGDHVHVAWKGDTAPAGGPRVIAQGAPKPQEQWVDLPGGGQRNTATGETKNVPQPKGSGKLSATAINQQKDALDMIQGATTINNNLSRYESQIQAGKLNLNPVNNIFSAGANLVGASTEASRNYASFKAGLEKLRNDSLRLNKGVQTEGDAVRAWNELIANIGDEGVVKQRLTEIKKLNEQAAAYHADVVAQLREDTGLPPIDTNRFRAPGSGAAAGRAPAVAPNDAAGSPPANALQAGHVTTFANGQKWTLRGGKPVRVQ